MHQIRRFDDLGRIVIPKEIREAATHVKNTEGVQMEVYMDDGAIVLKPHKPKDMVEVVRCKDCKFNVANMAADSLDSTDYSDITCSYFMTDGMDAGDFCSRGIKMDGGDKE